MVKKSKKDHKLAVLDFETDPFKHGREPEPFVGGVFDGKYYQDFWGDGCVEKMVEYIKEEYQGYTIYAHNGGKFDYFFMLKFFDEDITIINGRLSKLSINDVKFRDSINILPLALSAYKKDEFDYTKMEFEVREKNKPEIRKYLKNDCIYLFEWVKKFITRFGQKLTIAGTAFNELKKTDYAPQHTNIYYDEVFRPFYFGGRVETFQRGEILGVHDYIDINSAYPWAMLNNHPYGAKYIEKLRIPDNEYGGYFAKILAISKGALPMRDENGKLQFYRDNVVREYWVTGWEIIAGIQTGTLKIKKVLRVYVHEQRKNFKQFVNKWYDEKLTAKKNGDKDNETFSKLILNSCYGKFGQDPKKYKDYCLTPSNCVPEEYVLPEFRDPEKLDYWNIYAEHETGQIIWEKPAPSDRFYNVATAASITGSVRAYLWRAICDSDKPVYCDTDSLMCKKFSGEIGDKLGQWKIEAKLDKIYIGGRKFYGAHIADKNLINKKNWKIACKGARLTPWQIIHEIKTGEGYTWVKEAPSYSLKYGTRFLTRKITRQF